MKTSLIVVTLALVVVNGCCLAPTSMAKPPAPAKVKSATTSSSKESSSKDAELAQREKKIKSMTKAAMRSFAAVKLTAEQQEQAEMLFGKATKSFVTRRAEAMITDELQKKYAACLKEASGTPAKERAAVAFACAGFNEEQIKVYESTQKALDKAKRDFCNSLTETQIANLPKTLQKSINGEKH
jgi:transcriptional regulator of acetoin/glycerol metabolism